MVKKNPDTLSYSAYSVCHGLSENDGFILFEINGNQIMVMWLDAAEDLRFYDLFRDHIRHPGWLRQDSQKYI